MSETIRSVNSKRMSYPDRIEDETFCLIKKSSGVHLIYEVELRDGTRTIKLGTCKVLDSWVKGKGHQVEVKELKVQSSIMRKRMKEITKLIREHVV